jgi:outer membrane receptor protein involved in Fe transport
MLQKGIFIIGLLFLSVGFGFSQGSITGTVTDAVTGEVVIGANVVVQGTLVGSATDIEGKFLIKNIAAGTYTLQVSFVTYKTHTIPDVIVENGKRATIDIQLHEDVSELTEVVVSGTRAIDNDFSLISAIRESKLVVTGVSAEMISRTPDRDASEVVKRVPGVTVMGGRFIVIRGLNERYNVSMLHNAYAPSMEADRRSFAFDIIPSGQIDQLLVFKSPSPELPGDFAGGVVKITTKGIPDESNITVGYSMGYRDGTTGNNFSSSERSGSQFLGFNSKSHDLPSSFPSTLGTDNTINARAARSLKQEWVPQQNNAFLDQSISLNGSFKLRLNNISIGNVTAINLSQSRTNYAVERNDFDAYDPINDKSVPRYEYVDTQNNLNVRLGVIHNWAFKLNENNSIEFKNLFNQINNSQYISRKGFDYSANQDRVLGGFSDVYRGLYSGQLLGKHKLNDSKTNVNWVLNSSYSYRDLPNSRRYTQNLDVSTGVKTTIIPANVQSTTLGSFYANLDEISYSGSVGFDHTFEITEKLLPVVAAGIFYENKSRDFSARNFGYWGTPDNTATPVIEGYDPNLVYLPINELFQNTNLDGKFTMGESTNKSDSYDASNKLLAYYGSLSIPLGKVNIAGGVRIENNSQHLNSAQFNGTIINQTVDVTRVLPSANVSYSFNEKMLVRATYGQTLNRPEFREIAPFGFYDFEYNFVFRGDEDLKTAKIQNYDVRWEFYPSKSETITLGAFYKDFSEAIEMNYVLGSGSVSTFTFANAKNATSYGVELDVRKSLDGLTTSKVLNKMNVLFNAALIKSEVQVENQPKRQLMGQSPYVVNAGVYYNHEEKGWQVALLYNVAGKRLFAVGGYLDSGISAYENIYEMPRNVLDFSISKRIQERVQVKLSVSDILNQKYVLMQDGDADGDFSRTKDQIIQSNRYGSLITFGLTYKVK